MKKKCLCLIILFKIYIFPVCSICYAKACIFCCCLIGAAVDSDDLMVFLQSHCQVTVRNYIFRVSVYVVHTNF